MALSENKTKWDIQYFFVGYFYFFHVTMTLIPRHIYVISNDVFLITSVGKKTTSSKEKVGMNEMDDGWLL